jgi:D-alanyl-D-alanine carboxypeptidase
MLVIPATGGAERVTGARAHALQAALDSACAALGARGASATVILADGSTWTGVHGLADSAARVTPETVFEIGSITKTFTAALVLQLATEGVLDLDAPFTRWVEGFPHADGATLRRLLNHTSGIADAFDHPELIPTLILDPERRWTPQATFAYAGEPRFAPGAGWDYSSTNYHLLGVAAVTAGGDSMSAQLRRRFIGPLGLRRTFYAAEERMTAPLAHAYLDHDEDGEEDDMTLLVPRTALLTAAGAAGCMVSSSPDLARWTRALVAGGVIADSMRRHMTAWVDRPDGHRHGLGVLRVELDGVALIGHRGNSMGYSAAVWHAPEAGVTIVVLTNRHGVLVTPIVRALLRAARDEAAGGPAGRIRDRGSR